MRTLFILFPILASLYGAATPSVGEIDTVETLMNFRAARGNVWRDLQTGQPLERRSHKNEFVQAACDADITFTTATTTFNAGTIMGGYLENTETFPQATTSSAMLSALVADQKWNALLSLAKNHRVSLGRIARDCFGRELFEVAVSAGAVAAAERRPAADVRDIVDISTLIAAIEPAIREAGMPAAAVSAPVFTAAELSNYESLLAFRVGRSVISIEPRTGQQLYRFINDVLVPAAKDGDVLPNLSNLVALMASSYTTPLVATCVGAVNPSLATIFADANLNRLYQLVEDTRRAQGRMSVDAIGRPLCLQTRVQIVNMLDITDTASLLKAVFGFFPEGVRPTIPAGIC